jgi:hypothetical protein
VIAEPEPPRPRRSWLARLFARRAPVAPGPEPGAGQEPEPEPEPTLVQEQVEQAPDPLHDALTAALDSLGQAHHRPFSRG